LRWWGFFFLEGKGLLSEGIFHRFTMRASFFVMWFLRSLYFMAAKLYVGNLSYDTTEDELRTLFTQAGTVTEVVLIKDRETGTSKGFAFVSFESQSDAEKAIAQFNGKSLRNRELTVNVARPREERPSSGYDSNSRGGGNRSNSRGGRPGGSNRRY
jgi:RNA recognition motif-containing protein